MNFFIKAFLIISITSGAVIAQECKANVIINTNVENASLFINNVFESEGNNFELELEPGIYSIILTEGLSKWNTEKIEDTLRITDCRDITLDFEFGKKIFLDSDPQGAYVFHGDSLVGFTPLLLRDNFQSLILQKPGYSGKTIEQTEINSGIKPVLPFTGEVKGESFYDSFLFKVLAGTAIALGAATAYYKLEADKNFDKYQITGDQYYLDQTDKFDVISGVTFVALQINFGLILYMFITD
jgi:hypothetical protein